MTIKIIGRQYSDEAQYCNWDSQREFPYFKEVAKQEWEIEASSLKEAEEWLAKNHPDMYMGANIICENGDFSCLAGPYIEYGIGNYETQNARIAWVKGRYR